MTGDAFDALRRRDEILEVMYWMRGERLGEVAGAEELRVFMGDETPVLAQDLVAMAADGLIEAEEPGSDRFQLTRRGVEEGGRRFADDFAEMQKPGHGECNRPGCLCHQLGPDACVSQRQTA